MRRVALIALVAAVVFGVAPSARADYIWAQSVVGIGNDGNHAEGNPLDALGAPDGKFYGLGIDSADGGNLGGWIALDFGTLFQNVAVVFEVTYGCVPTANPIVGCQGWSEGVKVYASSAPLPAFVPNSAPVDNPGWTWVGDIYNDQAQSGRVLMGIGGPFRYLLLADKSANIGALPGQTGGFDVDAVGVVPEPASMLLLGTGLLGLAVRRRSRK